MFCCAAPDNKNGGPPALQPGDHPVCFPRHCVLLQRWSGEIVACISEDDERALASKQASDRQVCCSPFKIA